MLQLGVEEVPLQRPGSWQCSNPLHIKGNSKEAAAQCDKSHNSVGGRTPAVGGQIRRDGFQGSP
jgi:hypothetical protein